MNAWSAWIMLWVFLLLFTSMCTSRNFTLSRILDHIHFIPTSFFKISLISAITHHIPSKFDYFDLKLNRIFEQLRISSTNHWTLLLINSDLFKSRTYDKIVFHYTGWAIIHAQKVWCGTVNSGWRNIISPSLV